MKNQGHNSQEGKNNPRCFINTDSTIHKYVGNHAADTVKRGCQANKEYICVYYILGENGYNGHSGKLFPGHQHHFTRERFYLQCSAIYHTHFHSFC